MSEAGTAPEKQETVEDTVTRMLEAIQKQELVSAILTLRVQQEIWLWTRRLIIALVSVFALTGSGVAYYLFAVLPEQAANSAKQMLSENLRRKMSDLKEQEEEIDGVIAKIKTGERDMTTNTNQASKLANNLLTKLTTLEGERDGLSKQIGGLNKSLEPVAQQVQALQSLKSEEITKSLTALTGPQGDALRSLMTNNARDALLMTAGACPSGWTELTAARGAFLIAENPPAKPDAKPREATRWTVPFLTANLPRESRDESGKSYRLSIPVLKFDNGRGVSEGRVYKLDSCHDCAAKPDFKDVTVQLSSIDTPANDKGANQPIPIGQKYGVTLCKIK